MRTSRCFCDTCLPFRNAPLFLASQPKATHVKMENCDQRVIIFFALCPLSYAIIRGVIREGVYGVGWCGGGKIGGEEQELLKKSFCHTARAFGQKEKTTNRII